MVGKHHHTLSLFIAIQCLFLWQSLAAQKEAKLFIAQTVHDFGRIEAKRGPVKHAFVVRNDGEAPLELLRVACANRLVSTQWPKTPIGAGQTARIEVTYNPAGQSGDFNTLIEVLSNASTEATALVIKGNVRPDPNAPKAAAAEFSPDQWTFDFGKIKEEDGFAMHVFRIKNTGTAPLNISHVQSSCGCTEPEWTRTPIPAGSTGDVVITYDPTDRPGPFRKNVTVYSDAKGSRHKLTITGEVIPAQHDQKITYPDTIGHIGVQQHRFDFYLLREREIASQEVWIQNLSESDMRLSFTHLPAYIHVEAPTRLAPQKPERMKVTVDAKAIHGKGRTIGHFVWKSQKASGGGEAVTREIPVAVNVVDDFSTLSQADKDAGPALKLSATVIDFTQKKGATKQQLTLTNSGRSPLAFYSLTCDAPWVKIAGNKKKTLRPGESMTLTLTLKRKERTGQAGADLYVVCNDPQGPVRIVRIKTE